MNISINQFWKWHHQFAKIFCKEQEKKAKLNTNWTFGWENRWIEKKNWTRWKWMILAISMKNLYKVQWKRKTVILLSKKNAFENSSRYYWKFHKSNESVWLDSYLPHIVWATTCIESNKQQQICKNKWWTIFQYLVINLKTKQKKVKYHHWNCIHFLDL